MICFKKTLSHGRYEFDVDIGGGGGGGDMVVVVAVFVCIISTVDGPFSAVVLN